MLEIKSDNLLRAQKLCEDICRAAGHDYKRSSEQYNKFECDRCHSYYVTNPHSLNISDLTAVVKDYWLMGDAIPRTDE